MSRAARRPDPFHVPQVDLNRAQRWPIGQMVTVTQDDGSAIDSYTRSAPWRLDSGTWVILVAGFAGCYALARVTER